MDPDQHRGSRVKNWVYPMTPWTTMTPSSTRPASWTWAGASVRHSTQSRTKSSTTRGDHDLGVDPGHVLEAEGIRLAPLPPAWGPVPVVAAPAASTTTTEPPAPG